MEQVIEATDERPWLKDYIEKKEYAAVKFKIQTVAGFVEVMERHPDGRGAAEIGWWISGMAINYSATMDFKLLQALVSELTAVKAENEKLRRELAAGTEYHDHCMKRIEEALYPYSESLSNGQPDSSSRTGCIVYAIDGLAKPSQDRRRETR